VFNISLDAYGGQRFDRTGLLAHLIRYFSEHRSDLDPVTLSDFPTENNGEAADDVGGHILKPRPTPMPMAPAKTKRNRRLIPRIFSAIKNPVSKSDEFEYRVERIIDGAKKNLERIGKGSDYFEGKILNADSSYHSVTNIAKSNAEKLDAYIPDNKFRKGMNKYTLRGKIKVNIQWLLYCMVHNMEKIANYGFT
jgi:hypothetical protein